MTTIGNNGSPPQATADRTNGATEQPTTVHDTVTGVVTAQQVEVENCLIGVLTAGEVTAQNSLIVIGTAGSLDGDVQVLLDSRSALLLGAAFGFAVALIGRLFRPK